MSTPAPAGPLETEAPAAHVHGALAEAGLLAGPEGWAERWRAVTAAEVRRELAAPPGLPALERLLILASPAAEAFLEPLAQAAHHLTLQRFGRAMQLYVPLYVSSYCVNRCRYCGFSGVHAIPRRRLSLEEAVREGQALADQGFRDLLLVSGEDPAFVNLEYLEALTMRLRERFDTISVEIYALDEAGYRRLHRAGVDGVTLYQETYDPQQYSAMHPPGPKASYRGRLGAQEAAARAGIRQLGLGALLGLADWRFETLCLGVHARTLMQRWWRSKVSFSFPRIRGAPGVALQPPAPVGDRALVQMMAALRLCFPDAGLVLSTREPKRLRDHLLRLGVTRLSAGSRTTPGGYAAATESSGQFEVSDERSAAEVAASIEAQGYEPVWKDWDRGFHGPA
jgi:2-iminoacetate synthase